MADSTGPGGGAGSDNMMKTNCEEYQILISGFLDGELTAEERRRLEGHTGACSVCRREYEAMQRVLVGIDAACRVAEPPPEVWDTFLDDVYNRLERSIGWFLFVTGAVALVAYAVILFALEPWASSLLKLLIAVPILGLAVLFASVWRQRLRVAKTDRYSREVHR